MYSISKWAVLMSLAVLLTAAGCGTTGGSSTQTIIHDTHARMVKLDKELGTSVSQLNESSATLNARIDASDEQTRALRGLLEENQVKLDALSRELADMKTTLYRHWNLSTSGGPRNVSTGAVTIESPQGGVQTPPSAPVQTPPAAQTPVPAPVPAGTVVLEDSAPLPTESASPAAETPAAPTSEYATEPVAAAPAAPPEAAPAAVDPKLLYQQAQRSYANDDYAGALSQFDSYLAQYSNNDPDLSANAQFWKAKCLFNMNRYDESVKSFEALRTSYPTSTKVPFAMHNQAVAHSRLGQTAEAERLMEGVIEQYPVSPAADQARADLRKLRGE